MSGCFGNSRYDRWMEGELNRYLDEQSNPNGHEFSFHTRLRGGTVKVVVVIECQDGSDEDGPGSCLVPVIQSVCWSFDEDFDVDLTDDEEADIQVAAYEQMRDEISYI